MAQVPELGEMCLCVMRFTMAPRVCPAVMLVNLKPRVLIYYSLMSLSSHANLCPIAECDVMSSCNDEQTCEGRQISIKKKKE